MFILANLYSSLNNNIFMFIVLQNILLFVFQTFEYVSNARARDFDAGASSGRCGPLDEGYE